MQTRITARHFEAPAALRSHVTRSLGRLERYVERAGEAHVILTDGGPDAEKRAEIALSAPRQSFRAASEKPSLESAVDDCVRQLRRQALRLKERRLGRRASSTGDALDETAEREFVEDE